MEENMKLNKLRKDFSRRKVLIGGGAALAAPAILSITRAYAANPKLKVGFVSPKLVHWEALLKLMIMS